MKWLWGSVVCVGLAASLAVGCDSAGSRNDTSTDQPEGTNSEGGGSFGGGGGMACLAGELDKDGDGFCSNPYASSHIDCDDNDPNRHPRAAEVCNGKDDDCDGVIDNGVTPACEFSCEAPDGGCETMTAIAAGVAHVCALSSSGGVYCWGSNSRGGLGIPDLPNSTVPVAVPGVKDATALVASDNVACALAGEEALCWGVGSAFPFAVALEANVTQIAVTDGTLYSLARDGTVSARALLPKTEVDAMPSTVSTSPQASITAHGQRFCMVDSAGALQCPAATDENEPFFASGVSLATATADGSICYIQAGALHCADAGNADQVFAGNGSAVGVVKSVGFGCATAASGKTACWAAGPTTINDAKQLAVGSSFGCVLRKNGSVSCWGTRDNGALGDGLVNAHREAEPINVSPAPTLTLANTVLLRSPALGACDDLRDVAYITSSLGTGDVHSLFANCSSKCANTLDSAACFQDCAKNPGLSAACFGCFAQYAACSGRDCYKAFNTCAGYPVDFLAVAHNEPRFECSGADCMSGGQVGSECSQPTDCMSGACNTLPQLTDHPVCAVSNGASCSSSSAFCACAFGESRHFGACGGCPEVGRIGSAAGYCFRDCTSLNYCEVGQKCEFFSDYVQKYCE